MFSVLKKNKYARCFLHYRLPLLVSNYSHLWVWSTEAVTGSHILRGNKHSQWAVETEEEWISDVKLQTITIHPWMLTPRKLWKKSVDAAESDKELNWRGQVSGCLYVAKNALYTTMLATRHPERWSNDWPTGWSMWTTTHVIYSRINPPQVEWQLESQSQTGMRERSSYMREKQVRVPVRLTSGSTTPTRARPEIGGSR